jgi:hypothetical protein
MRLNRIGMIAAVGASLPVALVGVPGVLLGTMAAGLVAIEVLSRRDGFGFAQGFMAYDGRLRWPHGVQEDDDFQWRWTAPRGDSSRPGRGDPDDRPDAFAASSQLRPTTRARFRD